MNQAPGLSYHIGTVSQVDPATCTARVRIDELGGMQSWNLQVLQNFAGQNTMYAMPSIGDRVACLLDTDGSRGIVLGGIYDASNPPPANGLGLLAVAIPTTTLDGNVTITGDVTITGNVGITGDTATTGAVTVQGSHAINGKDTVVVTAIDTRGDSFTGSGQ